MSRAHRSLRGSASFEPPKAMQKILDTLYLHRSKDDRLLSRLFQELPDRKLYQDYYLVINKPIALDNIQATLKQGGYAEFPAFIRDLAQVFWNARFYNNGSSQVFHDAVTLEGLLSNELEQLKAKGVIEDAAIPDLGPIPQSSPISSKSGGDGASSRDSDDSSGSDSDSDEEDEEDDGAIDNDDEDEYNEKSARKIGDTARATRPRTRRSIGGKDVEGGKKDDSTKVSSDETPKTGDAPKRRKRGRPPKIDTPEEARIRSILRAIRKVKDEDGRQLFTEYEKLPDPDLYPDYYNEIKKPIALDQITRKIKRRDYLKMEFFVADMKLMFDNAKLYNADESQIYDDAVALQKTLVKVSEEEKKKSDADYINRGLARPATTEGATEGALVGGRSQKIPIGHVESRGERYEIGDWLMLTNPNDTEKPIVAQIFKMWNTSAGESWINVCWYYRPEQTVHRSSRLFYENEVFKSGQYRDHPATQILSKTFVQFITRYTRGRPKHWPANERIWVVESRYNDITRAFSKINQWRACIPEEVRFDEDDLFLFEKQRSYERFASPLLGMLGEKVYGEGEKLPDPIEPGSDEGPPKVGAIYRGDSPEPEREPTPPPPPPPPPPVPQAPAYKNPILAGIQQYRPMAPQQQPYAIQPQQRFAPTQQRHAPPPPPPSEQPLAFTMPIAVPSEVGELVARDNQGRVLWFGVPPVDIVGWGGGEGVRGHSLEYLVRKRKMKEEVSEEMGEVEVPGPVEDRGVKKQASELLVKALGILGSAK